MKAFAAERPRPVVPPITTITFCASASSQTSESQTANGSSAAEPHATERGSATRSSSHLARAPEPDGDVLALDAAAGRRPALRGLRLHCNASACGFIDALQTSRPPQP